MSAVRVRVAAYLVENAAILRRPPAVVDSWAEFSNATDSQLQGFDPSYSRR